MNALLILLLFWLLVTLLYRFLLSRIILKRLHVERIFSKPVVTAGDQGEMTEIISNPSPFPLIWLRLESSIANALQFSEKTDLNLNGDRHIQSLFSLLPRQRIIRRYPVTFRKRGHYTVSSSAVTAGDVTGLARVMQDCSCHAEVLVRPRLLPDSALPPILLGTLGTWQMNHPLSEDPCLIRGLREYLPGDPIRSIHWPATAKTGQAMIKLYDPAASSRLLVILNGQKTEHQWSDLMEYEQEEIESAISLSATLCAYALRHGCAAGFASNLKVPDMPDGIRINPRSGQSQQDLLLDTFARLQVLLGLRFETFLKTLNPAPGTDLLLLSFYQTDELQVWMQEMQRRGFRIQLHLMNRPG